MDSAIQLAAAAARAAAMKPPPGLGMACADENMAECWAACGGPLRDEEGQLYTAADLEALSIHDAAVAILATFVRAFPDAAIEALYRHAGGQGVHDRPADGFDDVPAAFRIAYAVFRATLVEADRVFAEEERRAAARAEQDRPQPPLLINAEDTILEQHGRIFEKIGDRPAQVNLGGPVVAASEGEGGDEAQHLEQLAGGATDPNHVDPAAAAAGGLGSGADAAGLPGEDQHAVDAPAAEGEGEAGPAAAPDDAGGDEALAGGAAQPEQPDGVDGAAAADTPPAPSYDPSYAPAAPVKRGKR